MAGSPGLFRAGIGADLLMIALDVAVAFGLYKLLRPVNRSLALAAAALRLIQAAILTANLLNLSRASDLAQQAIETGSAGTAERALQALETHALMYDVALIAFGLSCLVLGRLLRTSRAVPRLLALGMSVTGLVYLVGSLAAVAAPGLSSLIDPLYGVAIIVEPAFALWLIVKGIDVGVSDRADRAPDGGPAAGACDAGPRRVGRRAINRPDGDPVSSARVAPCRRTGPDSVEEAQMGQRPVHDLGLADDALLGHERIGRPQVRVARSRPVVSEDEKAALGHDGPALGVVRRQCALHDVGPSVHVRPTVPHLDAISGQADDTLHEGHAARRIAGLQRRPSRLEHDDVPAPDVAEPIDEPVRDHAVVRHDRRLHRARGDLVRLGDGRLDREGQREGDGQRQHHVLEHASQHVAVLGVGREADSAAREPGHSGSAGRGRALPGVGHDATIVPPAALAGVFGLGC